MQVGSTLAAEQRPENAADDLAADRGTDGSHRTLGHRLDQAVLASAARHQAAERALDRIQDAALVAGCGVARGRGRGCPPGELLVGRLAVDRLLVGALDR